MPISSLTELRAAVRDYAKRASLGDALINTFVDLTEMVVQNGERDDTGGYFVYPLRTRAMETIATVVVTDGAGTLPSDFLEPITVRNPAAVTSSIQYATPEFLADRFPTGQPTTNPTYYTIIGNTLYCPVDIDLPYYAKVPSLVADNQNWLLTAAPGVYLYGCLAQYSVHDKDADKYTGYRQLMNNALGGLNYADVNSRAGSMTRRSAMPAF